MSWRFAARAAALVLCLSVAPPAVQQAAAAAPPVTLEHVASAVKLQLRWEFVHAAQGPGLPAQARFVLTNHDSHPLPPQGWSLYFNCVCRMPSGALPSNLMMEQVAGGLFRLRPGPDFTGVAPGAKLAIDYRFPDAVLKLSKAPNGPYLVYEAVPERALAIGDYALAQPAPQQALSGGSTPEDTYRRNARADLLPPDEVPLVLPTPLKLEKAPGYLRLQSRPTVSAAPALAAEASLANSLFPPALPSGGAPLRLSIGTVPGQPSPEAYALTIRAEGGIAIVGNSAAGVFYGLQTLRDLMPLPDAANPALPEVNIADAPRFGYRGFQLDVARNFHDKQTVFKWLDLMARYKLNALHLHLTDDEGWRIEIAGLPELTSIGAVRGHSDKPGVRLQPAYGSGPNPTDKSGSGFYTRADYIEILRYAAARHIDVIPEIEMPGHARAAVQAMEARYHRLRAARDKGAARYLLNDLEDRSVYHSAQYYTDNVMNPGLESTYRFIDHVVSAVAALHRAAGVPLRTMHVGGDELANGAWEQSPASRALMQKQKLATTADLWDYFYDRVDAIVRKQGMFASGWEEIASRKTQLDGRRKLIPNPHFTQRGFSAYVWNNTAGAEDFAYRLANAGYDVVLAPVTAMYMDQSYNANPDEPGVNWGAYIELDDVYDFIPFDYLKNAAPAARIGKDGLTDYGRAHVRGLEATLFTETVRDPLRIDYLVMPRLLAVAERAWAPDPDWARETDSAKAAALHRVAWSGFVNALSQRVLPRLDLEQAGVAYRIAPPGLLADGDRVLVNHVLPGITMRYTVDGSVPTNDSPLVTGPIAARGVIQAAAFDRNGRRGLVARLERP